MQKHYLEMVEETQAPELKEYHGNCHCGNFRFSVKLAPLKQVMACNCSICSRVCPAPNMSPVFCKGKNKLQVIDLLPIPECLLVGLPYREEPFDDRERRWQPQAV